MVDIPENLTASKNIYQDSDIWFNTPMLETGRLGFYNPRNLRRNLDDDLIVVEQRHEFRPFVLQYDLYATDKLWWIFAHLNKDILIDPIRDMREGIVLQVPKRERILNLFQITQ